MPDQVHIWGPSWTTRSTVSHSVGHNTRTDGVSGALIKAEYRCGPVSDCGDVHQGPYQYVPDSTNRLYAAGSSFC